MTKEEPMSPTQIVVIVLVVLVIVAALARGRWLAQPPPGPAHRFGPEYDRVVAGAGQPGAAERELRDRERRHAELTLTPLSPSPGPGTPPPGRSSRSASSTPPAETVGDADELVTRLIAEQGYPTGDFADQIAHLSVEHARTLTHYRDAHEIHLRNARGEASTEELRQAVVHYRALFADLLGEEPVGHRHARTAPPPGPRRHEPLRRAHRCARTSSS